MYYLSVDYCCVSFIFFFFFSSRRRHTRYIGDWSSDVCSSDLSIEKRMSHGFTFLANYTYSKSLDDLPFGEGVSGFDTGYSRSEERRVGKEWRSRGWREY